MDQEQILAVARTLRRELLQYQRDDQPYRALALLLVPVPPDWESPFTGAVVPTIEEARQIIIEAGVAFDDEEFRHLYHFIRDAWE